MPWHDSTVDSTRRKREVSWIASCRLSGPPDLEALSATMERRTEGRHPDQTVEKKGDRFGATVVFGRFVMGVRAFLTPLAGAARMSFGQLSLADSLGAL